MSTNILKKIPKIKRYCRLMEYSKKDNSNRLSFLVSSDRNFSILLSDDELKIFELINSKNSISEIKIKTQFEINDILNLLNKFDDKKILTYESQNKDSQFDRHDLYFDMCFNKENFTENVLVNKRIIIVGAGGIGNNVLILLSRMGIQNFIIIDNDKIELSNLTRQFMFGINDIHKNKIEVLEEKLKQFNENIKCTLINKNFNSEIYNDLEKENNLEKIDFALNIPYTTAGYLNDFLIFGPIIYKKIIDMNYLLIH